MGIPEAIEKMLKNGYRKVPGKRYEYKKENIYVSLMNTIQPVTYGERTWFHVTDKIHCTYFSPWIEPILDAKNFDEYCSLWERTNIINMLEKM